MNKTVKNKSFFYIFNNRKLEDEDEDSDEIDDIDLEYDIEGIADSLKYVRDFIWKYSPASYYGVSIPDYDITGKY